MCFRVITGCFQHSAFACTGAEVGHQGVGIPRAFLLLESLEALNRRLRATVLMVTHDSFAASYTSRVLFIRDGKIFTELRRGDTDRREFFDRIMEVVAMMGGEGSDAL